MSTYINKEEILKEAKSFFKEVIVKNHLSNLNKLKSLSNFQYNPFLVDYLAVFLEGKATSKNIAKVLVYPRILSTSINTSFGQNIQTFCSRVLPGYGSAIQGIDLEFIDQVDRRKKYCQIKAGPNTINKDDVITIKNHFQGIKNLARTNNLEIHYSDLIIGILYGESSELNANYKNIAKDYSIFVGQEFWYRLTGDRDFYKDLINVFSETASEYNAQKKIKNVINILAVQIEKDLIK